jgi:hypothetical protein
MVLFMVVAARCCVRPARATSASPLISLSRSFGGFGGGSQESSSTLFTRHGDEKGMDLHPRGCCWMNLQQGSGEASLGSAFTAALRSLPSLMVERRPLPPLLAASVSFGRRLKATNNLQATMPRRPLCSTTVSSRCPAPSGYVPGDEAVDCGAKIRFGGEGAGPDGAFLVRSRVFCEKSVDLFAISYFLRVLDVTCKSTDNMI